MILYHGTTHKLLHSILSEGICPNIHSNWDHTCSSKPDFVYLSSTYALYYAMEATNNLGGEPLLIQVEVDEDNLYPDEDYIARLVVELEKKNGKQIDLIEATEQIELLVYQRFWKQSLEILGNVAHYGIISPKNIIQYRVITDKYIKFNAVEPVISPANFLFCGQYYRSLIQYALGEITFDRIKAISRASLPE